MTKPYRMLRLPGCLLLLGAVMYGQTALQTTSMASYGPIVSPDSIAAVWGTTLAGTSTPATTLPLQTTLGGVQVTITDSTGAKIAAPLFFVSAGQINIYVPANVAVGKATVTLVTNTSQNGATGTLLVSNVAPAIFTANANGKGVPAAQILRVSAAGVATYETPFGTTTPYTATPINVSASSGQAYLVLYGTGIRRHSPNPVIAMINGVSVPVLYAGAQSQFPGLDQVNIGPIPASLAGAGLVNVVLMVDGVPANTTQIMIQ